MLTKLSCKPHINLLIATLDRKDLLYRFLHSLEKQTYKNFSVFIASQNDRMYLDDIKDIFTTLDITVITVPAEGVSKARNAIMPFINSQIVAFPDDDCLYCADTLENVVSSFLNNNIGSVVGVWRPREDLFPHQSFNYISRIGCFHNAGTCVQFYRSEVVKQVGLFDEILGPGTGLAFGGGEDTDFLLRAYETGYSVGRDSAIHILHPNPIINSKKIRAYAFGRMFLLEKHNFSIFFKIFNVIFPIIVIPIDIYRSIKDILKYRVQMFYFRTYGFMFLKNITNK